MKDGRIACSPHESQFFYIVGRIPRILDSVAARDDLILVQEGGRTRIKLITLVTIPCENTRVCILRHISV